MPDSRRDLKVSPRQMCGDAGRELRVSAVLCCAVRVRCCAALQDLERISGPGILRFRFRLGREGKVAAAAAALFFFSPSPCVRCMVDVEWPLGLLTPIE